MVNIFTQICISPKCESMSNSKCRGYCSECFADRFPEESCPKQQNYKIKERLVANYLRSQIPSIRISYNKRLDHSLSLCRPDLTINLDNKIIIIDITKKQPEIDQEKIDQMRQHSAHIPIIMIWFNPGSYKIGPKEEHKTVRSCFKKNDSKIVVLDETQKEEWADRLKILKTLV